MKRKVIYQKRKSISLQVVNEMLVIKVPYKVSMELVDSFILKKQKWLDKQYELNKRYQVSLDKPINILGTWYPVVLNEGKFSIELQNNQIVISKPKSMSEETTLVRLKKYLNLFIEHYILDSITECQHKREFHYSELKIKKLTASWGNCSSKKRLTFSNRLIHTSIPFINAIVCHEVSHLFEMNHSKQFYEHVYFFCPTYQEDIKAFTRPTV